MLKHDCAHEANNRQVKQHASKIRILRQCCFKPQVSVSGHSTADSVGISLISLSRTSRMALLLLRTESRQCKCLTCYLQASCTAGAEKADLWLAKRQRSGPPTLHWCSRRRCSKREQGWPAGL